MGTLRFFEEVVSFKIRRTFGFADYTEKFSATSLKAMSLYMTGYEKDSAHFLHAVRL